MHGTINRGARAKHGVLLVGVFLLPLAIPVAAQSPPTAGPISKRLCKPRVDWTSAGTTRADAQRKAIDGWSAAAAAAHGDGFTKWTLAGIARVSCSLTPEGHRCRAAGSPCRELTESPSVKR